jgi:hypothetical protein
MRHQNYGPRGNRNESRRSSSRGGSFRNDFERDSERNMNRYSDRDATRHSDRDWDRYNDGSQFSSWDRGYGSERSPNREQTYAGGVDTGLDRSMSRDFESHRPGISYDSDYGFGRRDDSDLTSHRAERSSDRRASSRMTDRSYDRPYEYRSSDSPERTYEASRFGSQDFSYGSGASLPNYGYETGSRGWEEPSREKVGRFFGKGPKGYRRSDDRIREDVSEALCRHPHIDASEVEVSVSEGVVTLSGSVHERAMKRLIEDEAEKISGVKDVHNTIRFVDTLSSSSYNETSMGSGSATPSSTTGPGAPITPRASSSAAKADSGSQSKRIQ